MKVPEKIKEILSWYRSDSNAVLNNLCRLLMSGQLAGSGKLVILPVDQGFEHGPVRSFGGNPPAFDPHYHINLALESGCNAYAAPFGQIAAVAHDYIGQIPLIVKMNSSDTLYSCDNPNQAITCSVKDALAIGAVAVGFTIYPGSSFRTELFEEIAEMGSEARSYGLPVVIWSYPRGEGLKKEDETSIDVVTYAAHIACQLGAHIVKVKPPTSHITQEAHKKVIEKSGTPLENLSDRTRLVIQSCFNGRRIVIFSGGEAKGEDEVIKEVKALKDGGSFGSIMGRNAFQRPKEDGIKLLRKVIEVYKA